jgi:hypothetical protein
MEITVTLSPQEAQSLHMALVVAKELNAANAGTGAPGSAVRQTHEAQAVELPALVDKLLAAREAAARAQG